MLMRIQSHVLNIFVSFPVPEPPSAHFGRLLLFFVLADLKGRTIPGSLPRPNKILQHEAPSRQPIIHLAYFFDLAESFHPLKGNIGDDAVDDCCWQAFKWAVNQADIGDQGVHCFCVEGTVRAGYRQIEDKNHEDCEFGGEVHNPYVQRL